jgi:prevent-host-death family protein
MRVTVTEFRKNLFQIIDRALNGELVEVTHRGQQIRLVPEVAGSKLDRLVEHDCFPRSVEDFDAALDAQRREMIAAWDEKWDGRK